MEWNPRAKIYLPLSRADVCFSCGAKKQDSKVKLQLCTSCKEVLYCSPECQKKDWKAHRNQCGTTVRLDLKTFYPFLACIAQQHHYHMDSKHAHPALQHTIVNSPNPWNGGQIVQLPNGDKAKLVELGKKLPEWENNFGKEEWWPTAQSDEVRGKLARRIIHDGHLLPILLSICLSLVYEMYSTTSGRVGGRRIRLSINESPLSDFGIMRGSRSVSASDKLAFYFREDGTYLPGQDPNDHYWIYFTFLSGDVCLLDLGSMALNSCSVVDARSYWKPFKDAASPSPAPAIFYGSEESKMFPLLDGLSNSQFKPGRRFSILRDSRLSTHVFSLGDVLFYSVLDEIGGRASTLDEKYLAMRFFFDACWFLRSNLTNRDYLSYPKEPSVMYDVDPGEEKLMEDPAVDKAYIEYMQKWSRKLKKGKISYEEWIAAVGTWGKKELEARKALIASLG